MHSTLISDQGDQTYVLIFDKGDEVISTLKRFAQERHLNAAHFTAIGAFSDATLGYFERDRRDYKKIPVREQVEVLSLIGDIAAKDGKPEIHAHVVVGTSEGQARGGHILEATVWPTLEVVLTESPAHLRRTHDKVTGLALIDLEAGARGSRPLMA